ncbi:hypothetical protein AA0Z99_00200 [Agrococcus sp. 1P02AA]|uniref:hypothetical protein n=1 Tax=Agrococcus sp. 1P02AA TaxID=3132259 RepID=UPI0039A5A673
MPDPLDLIPVEACPDCGTVLHESGCRGCGFERPPLPGDCGHDVGADLPSISGW